MDIPLFDLDYGEPEQAAVRAVLDSKWLTMGEATQAFEREFAAYIGVKHAVAVTNCTAALHLANVAAGVGDGDEVICPSLTFVATANAVCYAGGRPVFADISSPDDWTVSPDDIEAKITPRTRAITVVHYAGFPCDMERICAVAERHGLAVIEDCAHSPGSTAAGKHLGTFGLVSCFSFFTNKNLSVGEGGMICTDDDEVAGRLRLLRSHGMTTLTLERHRGHAFTYDVTAPGFNYRIDEIRSALGMTQLKRLDRGNALRREAAVRYREALAGIDGVDIPFEGAGSSVNYHIFPVLLGEGIDRGSFMRHLREKGIQTSIHYPPVHSFSYYRELPCGQNASVPLTETVGVREVTLPMFPALDEDKTGYIAETIREYLADR